jgi:hypothetical protein
MMFYCSYKSTLICIFNHFRKNSSFKSVQTRGCTFKSL